MKKYLQAAISNVSFRICVDFLPVAIMKFEAAPSVTASQKGL